MMHCTTIA